MTRKPQQLDDQLHAGNDKPPVLLVHGMWSTDQTLHELRDAFADEGYEVQALCLPYHLAKADHTDASMAALARARIQDYVVYLVEQVSAQARPPILVGHSMGGVLVQLVAARVPCAQLVVLSSAAPAGINGLGWSVIRTLGRNLVRFPLWDKVTEVGLENIRYGVANSQSAELQQEIFEGCTYESGMATFQLSVGLILRRRSPAHVEVERIRCPVLIIGGTADRITPIRIQRRIAERFGAQASLIEIPGCCHWTIGGKDFPHIRSAMFHWLETLTVA
ncbi:alpha/beta hydrolase [Marinobacter salinisoli]|uniref:Alpha/beta hydrolase n=1 Tax=Marinobacter salinisoli TaxID=2769486 RepID=A0ABX7MQW4_9GAMM|nr:alpha/beta hydrolase [Marinobacter salinisoli]QSP94693.1 alpha/beta hydrolase [Marinobacter salinisoli]